MAAKKVNEEIKATEEVKVDDGYVEIEPLFYDAEKYSAPVFVGYNGKRYLMPRVVAGIRVPRAVKEILDNSAAQKQMAGTYIAKNEGNKFMGDFN